MRKDKDFIVYEEDALNRFNDKVDSDDSQNKPEKRKTVAKNFIAILIIMNFISFAGIFYLYNKLKSLENDVIGVNNKENIFADYKDSPTSQKGIIEQIAILNNTINDLQKVLNIKTGEIDGNFASIKVSNNSIKKLEQFADRLERTNREIEKTTNDIAQEQSNTKAYIVNIEERVQQDLVLIKASNNELIEKQNINSKQIIASRNNLNKFDLLVDQVSQNLDNIKRSSNNFRRQNNSRVLKLEEDILNLQKKITAMNDRLDIISVAAGLNSN